jgi:hypothetical protein
MLLKRVGGNQWKEGGDINREKKIGQEIYLH